MTCMTLFFLPGGHLHPEKGPPSGLLWLASLPSGVSAASPGPPFHPSRVRVCHCSEPHPATWQTSCCLLTLAFASWSLTLTRLLFFIFYFFGANFF